MRWGRGVALAVGVCLASGCQRGSEPAGTPHAGSGAQWDGFAGNPGPILTGRTLKPGDLTPTEQRFGIAPRRVPGVVYQNGVVLLENGDRVIRSFDSNGLHWTLDANDPRVAQLAKGQVL